MNKRISKIVYSNELIENQVTYDLMAYQKIIKKMIEWPVDLEFFAKSMWDLEVLYEDKIEIPGSADEIVGCLSVTGKKILINLSANQGSGRLNFTLAHEVGHVSLHSTLSKNLSTKELDDVIYCRRGNKKDDSVNFRLEQQANHYASCLLLPKAILLSELNSDNLIDLNNEAKILMDRFRVSRYALELRLFRLGFRTVNNKYAFG